MTEQNPRVVIADDELHVRAMMKETLRVMGYDVVGEAADGDEAVHLAARLKPDILLLDINMPRMSGIEALKAVVAELPDICAIMLTTVADTETVQICIGLGAANYIRKDTPLPQLKEAIAETWNAFKE